MIQSKFGGMAIAVISFGLSGCAAQRPPVYALSAHPTIGSEPVIFNKTALSGTRLFIGFVAEIYANCSSRGLPTVRVLTQPAHGETLISQTEDYPSFEYRAYGVSATSMDCVKRKVPGIRLDYLSDRSYLGPDYLSFEVIYVSGDDKTYNVNLMVK